MWEEQPVFQNLTLDLVCDRGQCQSQVWGYAPKYNQEVDHLGTVQITNTDSAWQLQVNLNIQPHPWQTETEAAYYEIELIPYQEQLIGSYQGQFKGRNLQGKVQGNIKDLWPIPVANHQPIQTQEHPRLIFRKSQLPALREKAKTPEGEAILKQLEKSLQKPVYYQGYVPNGGYHATGQCFLAILNEDAAAAEKAWTLVDNSLKQPENTLLKQSPIVAGVALAYDLCYDFWIPERRQQVTNWLKSQAENLIRGDSPRTGWNSNAWSNWNARARGAAGLAALAIIDEPSLTATKPHLSPEKRAIIAQRNLKRYLTTAIGDRGFGTEGDHYTTEVFILTVIPFLIAYRNVMGQDLKENSKAEWFLPHYLARAIPKDGDLPISTYGRHRRYAGGSLFAIGLELVPESLLPGILWLFDQNLGQGNQSFGIYNPHEAVFTFVGYPQNIKPENPDKAYDRVLVDAQKGFYVFRNHWQNQDDIVASIYLKQEPLGGSWSFPDVGSFRIWGLGEHWAKAGISESNWNNENVVIMPHTRPWRSSQVVDFQSSSDGSGIVSLATDKITVNNQDSQVQTALLRSFGVDYSGASGSPGLFVIVDQFLGNIFAQPFREKTWIMHTEGKVNIRDQEFLIRGKNGATLKGIFITPEPVKITYQKNELGGQIRATGGNNFFVIMTIQKEQVPEFKVTGSGLESTVQIGKQTIEYKDNQIVFSFNGNDK